MTIETLQSIFEGIIDIQSLSVNTADLRNGIRIEGGPDNICIYNQTRDKRYRIYESIDGRERTKRRSFQLEGQTSGGSWHTLMGISQNISIETGKEINIGITLAIIEDSTFNNLNYHNTPLDEFFYNAETGGKIERGAGVGYYGGVNQNRADLQRLGAIAITRKDLPRRIKVHETARSLVENFWKGKFEPPQFIK